MLLEELLDVWEFFDLANLEGKSGKFCREELEKKSVLFLAQHLRENLFRLLWLVSFIHFNFILVLLLLGVSFRRFPFSKDTLDNLNNPLQSPCIGLSPRRLNHLLKNFGLLPVLSFMLLLSILLGLLLLGLLLRPILRLLSVLHLLLDAKLFVILLKLRVIADVVTLALIVVAFLRQIELTLELIELFLIEVFSLHQLFVGLLLGQLTLQLVLTGHAHIFFVVLRLCFLLLLPLSQLSFVNESVFIDRLLRSFLAVLEGLPLLPCILVLAVGNALLDLDYHFILI